MEKAKKKINKTVIVILAIVLVVAMIIGVLFLIPAFKKPNFEFDDCGETSKMSLFYKYGYPQYNNGDEVKYLEDVEFYGIEAQRLIMFVKEQNGKTNEYTFHFDVEYADDVLSVIERKCDFEKKITKDHKCYTFDNGGQEFNVEYNVVNNDFVSVTIDYK